MLSIIFKHKNFKKSYLVNEGYTILEIARKYNVDVNQILKWNNLLPSKKIKKNQKIIILKSNEY